MKHKVAELSGALLDAAVAKAEGLQTVPAAVSFCYILMPFGTTKKYSPSRNWSDGGPIIERERIVCWPVTRYEEPPNPKDWDIERKGWAALHPESKGLGYYMPEGGILDVGDRDGIFGPTPLIAAMRAYVASKLGDWVELP